MAMAERRVIYVGSIEDVFALQGKPLWQEMNPRRYVCRVANAPGLTGQVWGEVRTRIEWAQSPRRGRRQLTERQTLVLESCLLGNDDSEIARIFDMSRQAVRKARICALAKIDRFKPEERGLITVMSETFGWGMTCEYCADLFHEWKRAN